ncbi:MAG: hypothetical protein M3N51_08375 [Actinomycetota bacterium]|nr:hypothetical protein [Actinomycetota bacterium]
MKGGAGGHQGHQVTGVRTTNLTEQRRRTKVILRLLDERVHVEPDAKEQVEHHQVARAL